MVVCEWLNTVSLLKSEFINDIINPIKLVITNKSCKNANDKIFYTTGRLTSEMIIKTVQMGIPILISRSGFTESGVKLAREAGLTLIGRAKGKRMIIANGVNRVIFDTDIKAVANEDVMSAQRSLIN